MGSTLPDIVLYNFSLIGLTLICYFIGTQFNIILKIIIINQKIIMYLTKVNYLFFFS